MATDFFYTRNRFVLATEFVVLFILLPLLLYWHTTHWDVPLALWVITGYVVYILQKMPHFSWREAWAGQPLTKRDFWLIVARFIISTIGVYLLTLKLNPELLFSFARERSWVWLIVMLFYPLLSALPQELVFRTFFLNRYAALFPSNGMKLAVSALIFGFIHIVFHNAVSPLLSVMGGFFFASSYMRHQSLKKAAIEHGFYGDMVFTLGLGLYFVTRHF